MRSGEREQCARAARSCGSRAPPCQHASVKFLGFSNTTTKPLQSVSTLTSARASRAVQAQVEGCTSRTAPKAKQEAGECATSRKAASAILNAMAALGAPNFHRISTNPRNGLCYLVPQQDGEGGSSSGYRGGNGGRALGSIRLFGASACPFTQPRSSDPAVSMRVSLFLAGFGRGMLACVRVNVGRGMLACVRVNVGCEQAFVQDYAMGKRHQRTWSGGVRFEGRLWGEAGCRAPGSSRVREL